MATIILLPSNNRAMLIRPFQPADADTVDAVALAAFAQYENVYDDWDRLRAGVGATSALAEHAELIVAEMESGIVGAVAYCPPFSQPRADFFAPEWPIIRMLVVHPRARGLGIGRALTEACIRRAREDGAAVISLHTSPAMEVALTLYLAMGFRLERHVPARFGVPYAVYTLDLRDEADLVA